MDGTRYTPYMNGPPQSSAAPPDAAESSERPTRKRCKNCPKFFELTKPNREFCTPKCKAEFHRYGAAYGPLKEKLERLVTAASKAEAAKAVAPVVAELVKTKEFIELLTKAGFVHRSQLRPRPEELRPLRLSQRIDEQGEHLRRVIDILQNGMKNLRRQVRRMNAEPTVKTWTKKNPQRPTRRTN